MGGGRDLDRRPGAEGKRGLCGWRDTEGRPAWGERLSEGGRPMPCPSPPWTCLNNRGISGLQPQFWALAVRAEEVGKCAPQKKGHAVHFLCSVFCVFDRASPHPKEPAPPVLPGPRFCPLVYRRYCLSEDLRVGCYRPLRQTHIVAAFIIPTHSLAGVDPVHTASRAGEYTAPEGRPHPFYDARHEIVLRRPSKLDSHITVGIRQHVSIKAVNLDLNSVLSFAASLSICRS